MENEEQGNNEVTEKNEMNPGKSAMLGAGVGSFLALVGLYGLGWLANKINENRLVG
ncbi:MAG: hypothetical protein ACOCQD_00975 [archaeon]